MMAFYRFGIAIMVPEIFDENWKFGISGGDTQNPKTQNFKASYLHQFKSDF
jgi:hypothetical protein